MSPTRLSLQSEHWVERSANEARARLGLRSFACRADADSLLDYVAQSGVEVRVQPDIDCIGEIHRFRGRFRLKLSSALDPSLLADVTIHEVAHFYTRSAMPAVCSPCFSWWWQLRDERNAFLWSAHFRLPTAPLLGLIRRGASWSDLIAECQAPDGLLALKLKLLNCQAPGQPAAPAVLETSLAAPMLASQRWRLELAREPHASWQHRLGLVDRATGERWAYRRAENPARLTEAEEEIAWDLVGCSAERFWTRWHDRLEPACQSLRQASPKASWASSRSSGRRKPEV